MSTKTINQLMEEALEDGDMQRAGMYAAMLMDAEELSDETK